MQTKSLEFPVRYCFIFGGGLVIQGCCQVLSTAVAGSPSLISLRGERRKPEGNATVVHSCPIPTEHPDACGRRVAGRQAQEGVKPETEPAGRFPDAVHASSPRGNTVSAGTLGLRTCVSAAENLPPGLEGICFLRQFAIRATAHVFLAFTCAAVDAIPLAHPSSFLTSGMQKFSESEQA